MFRFSSAPVKHKRPRETRRKKPLNSALTVEEIARIIDPEAWQTAPPPSRQEIAAKLAAAETLIAALRDELDWLDVIPTTPEQEYRQIRQEQGQNLRRFANPVLIQQPVQPVSDPQAQQVALAKARIIFDACRKMSGQRNTLHIVHGAGKARYYVRKGGL